MPLLWTSLILKENSNVAESVVVNASPLIFLSRAGLMDLLQLISAEVIVPTAQDLASTSWPVVTQTLQSQLKSSLG